MGPFNLPDNAKVVLQNSMNVYRYMKQESRYNEHHYDSSHQKDIGGGVWSVYDENCQHDEKHLKKQILMVVLLDVQSLARLLDQDSHKAPPSIYCQAPKPEVSIRTMD